MFSNLLSINASAPEPDRIARAVSILQSGGVVIFPTRCLYGLAADATNPMAVKKIFQIKKRRQDKPVLILIPDRIALEQIVTQVPKVAEKIMQHFWPGQVTIVFQAKPNMLTELTAGTGKIGIRLPGHPVAAALVKALNCPITGTSANPSTQNGCARIETMDTTIQTAADLILDAGPLAGGQGSTVVDVTQNPPRIIREGTVPADNIFALF